MANAEDYAKWIVANKDKQGTPEFDTVSRAYQAARSSQSAPIDEYKQAADSRSTPGKIKAGIASAPINLYLGAKQMLGGDLSPVEMDVLKQNRAASDAAPVSSFIGNVATAVPASMIPGANTVAGATLLGGGLGAMQPVVDGESRSQNAAIGAAGGALGQYVGGKIGRALGGKGATSSASSSAGAKGGDAAAEATASGSLNVSGKGGGSGFGHLGPDPSAGLNPAQVANITRGRELGVKYTPGQMTGSKVLQQMEAKLESQPMTSGTFFAIKDNNQTLLNRAAARAIGENADTVDSSVLEAAKDRISGVYKMVADNKPRTIDPDAFLGKLSQIDDDFAGLLPNNAPSIIDNPLVKQAYRLADGGQATGKQLQDLASKLGKAATNQMTSANGDRQVGMALSAVKDHVDDLLEQGLTGETKRLFGDARGQYRNLMMLTGRQGVVNPNAGNVNVRSLAGVLQSKDKNGFLFNKTSNDLYDTVRALQAVPGVVGDSGTATRMPINTPMDFLVSLPFNLATRAYTSGPVVNASSSIVRAANEGLVPGLRPLAPGIMRAGGLLGATLPLER